MSLRGGCRVDEAVQGAAESAVGCIEAVHYPLKIPRIMAVEKVCLGTRNIGAMPIF